MAQGSLKYAQKAVIRCKYQTLYTRGSNPLKLEEADKQVDDYFPLVGLPLFKIEFIKSISS